MENMVFLRMHVISLRLGELVGLRFIRLSLNIVHVVFKMATWSLPMKRMWKPRV